MARLQLLQPAKVEYTVAAPKAGSHLEQAIGLVRWILQGKRTGTLSLTFREGGLRHPSKWTEAAKLPANGKKS